MLITSRNNAKVKKIRSLRSRKGREQTGLFLIEGVHLVTHALQSEADIEALVIAPELMDELPNRLRHEMNNREGLARLDVSAPVFASVADCDEARGIGAVVRQRWDHLEDVKLTDELCWIAINAVQCPSNLGTLLRISDAVGGRGIILLENSADPYYPSAVRASLGAVLSQRLVRTTFREFAIWTRRNEYRVVGTSPSATVDYRSVEYIPPLVLLLGNEWAGLTPEQESLCDLLVRIPMAGCVESHNVAVAAGIILYEILGQSRRAV